MFHFMISNILIYIYFLIFSVSLLVIVNYFFLFIYIDYYLFIYLFRCLHKLFDLHFNFFMLENTLK